MARIIGILVHLVNRMKGADPCNVVQFQKAFGSLRKKLVS
jgi:hypothetical protein